MSQVTSPVSAFGIAGMGKRIRATGVVVAVAGLAGSILLLVGGLVAESLGSIMLYGLWH